MKRRKFIKNTFKGTVGLGLLTGLYTWQVEPFWLEFVEKKMPIHNLPTHLIGKTLMQISDIHVGNRFDYQFIINSFKTAQQQFQPDFVAYTGDYIEYENEEQFEQLKEVLQYAVLGKKGSVAILGNHDYGEEWKDKKIAKQVTRQLEAAGITVLSNSSVNLDGLSFLGLDDLWSPNFHPDRIMNSFTPEKANVALCHNPDVCDLNIWNGYQGWILSGHTHGGQCKPPFLRPPLLPVKNKKYSAGEIDLEDGRTLYINRALGNLLQVRFNVRPEITIFKLCST